MQTLGIQDPTAGGITAVPMAVPPVYGSKQQQPPQTMPTAQPMQQPTQPMAPMAPSNQMLPPVIWIIGKDTSNRKYVILNYTECFRIQCKFGTHFTSSQILFFFQI